MSKGIKKKITAVIITVLLCVSLIVETIPPAIVLAESDTTPPTLTGTSVSSVTSSNATLNFTSNEGGTYYYLIYAAADTAPTAEEVKAQGTAVKKGTGTATAAANTVSVTGLSASTAYKAYIIVEDTAGNQSAVAAIDISTWTADNVGGWVEDSEAILGLNYDQAQSATYSSMVEFNGEVYVAWQESTSANNNMIHVAKRSSSDNTWSFVDGGSSSGINIDPSKSANNPKLVVFNNKLYAVWLEYVTNSVVRVARYNGDNTWTQVSGTYELLYSTSYFAESVSACSDANGLYVALTERTASDGCTQIHVAKYDGTSWSFIDTGTATGLNISATQAANGISIISAGSGKLYLVWTEAVGSAALVYVKYYDGSAWTDISNGSTGLNYDSTKLVNMPPQLAIYKDSLYVAWSEVNSGGINQVRLKKYDGSGSSWTSVDGGATAGLNYDPSKEGTYVSLAADSSNLYLGWKEAGQLWVKSYNTTSGWTPLDSDGINAGGDATGINMDTTYKASFSSVLYVGSTTGLWAAFNEYSGNYINKAHCKRYDSTFSIPFDGDQIKSIDVTAGTLTPSFASNVYNYTVLVDQDTSSDTITLKAKDADAVFYYNGVKYPNEASITANSLLKGDNYIEVTLVSHKAAILKHIVIRINRAYSSTQRMVNAEDTYYDGYSTYPDKSWDGIYENWVGYDSYSCQNTSVLKFDYSFLTNPITAASMGFTVKNVTGTNAFVVISGSNNTSWMDDSDTFPSSDVPIILQSDSSNPVTSGSRNYDVTDFVTGQTSGTTTATFVLTGNTDTSAANCFNFYSNECTNESGAEAYRPYLLLTCADSTDATVTAGADVTEPVNLPSDVTTAGGAVNVFDFKITDLGTADSLSTDISQVSIGTSGTGDFSKVTWLMNGPDVVNAEGTYSSGSGLITFSGLNISVANASNETYIISAYFNDNTNLTDGQTYMLSVNGSSTTSFTVSASGSPMKASQTDVTNGTGSLVDVTATRLIFTTQPSAPISGVSMNQPVVKAVDVAGNVDTDYTGSITLSEASAGDLSGTASRNATAGIAAFSGLLYTATADGETFALTASAVALTSAVSDTLTSDVVATKLMFSTQPSPLSIVSGATGSFTTVPVVQAVDNDGIVDTGYSTGIVLTVTDHAGGAVSGTVNSFTCAGDSDGISTSVTLSPSNGTATYTGLSLQYTAGGIGEAVVLKAASGSFTVNSSSISVQTVPHIISVTPPSNASYKEGTNLDIVMQLSEAVTVTNNSGANNPYIFINLDNVGASGASGTVKAYYVSGSGTTTLVFRYTVAAEDEDANGITLVSPIELNGGTIKNASDMDALMTFTAPDTTAVIVDNTAPSVGITSTYSGTTSAAPIPVTITFSESVTGFDASDITVANGTKGSLSGSGSTYTLGVTPSSDGTVTVDINAGAAQDAAGNSSTAASQFSIASDRTAPTLSDVGSSNLTSTTVSISATSNESGTIYYIVVPDSSTTPTSAEVKAGNAYSGVTIVTKSSAAVSSSPYTHTFDVTGLSAGTAYDVYVVAEDGATTPNITATPTKLDVTTSFIQITSFDAIANINAGYVGSATYADAAAVIAVLPSTVTANGGSVSVPVSSWADTDGYNATTEGSYTFTATLGTLPAGYANAGSYTATVEVMIANHTYTVTYDINGGSGTTPTDGNSYIEGQSVTLANASGLSKTHYSFGGWSQTLGGSAISGSTFAMGTSNIILYAIWTENSKYTITYDANGGVGTVPTDSGLYYAGDVVTVISGGAISVANHTFGGWSTTINGGSVGSTYTMGNANTTFYAIWVEDGKYIVTYDANGGSGTVPTDNNQYYQGDTVTLLDGSSLTKLHYSYGGWALSPVASTVSGSAITMGGSNITLYALWSENAKYTVTYHANGGSGAAPTDSTQYYQGDLITLANGNGMTKSGYSFGGWSLTPGGTAVSGSSYTMGNANTTFYAVWVENGKYTVTYVANGGSGTVPTDSNQYYQGDTVTLLSGSSLTKLHYSYGGWALSPSLSAVSGSTITMGNSSVTLYALWTENAKYTVSYHANGGSGTAPTDSTQYYQGDSITLANGNGMTKSGYSFGGWSITPGGTAVSGSTYTMGNSNIAFYAVWTFVPTPTPTTPSTTTTPTTTETRQVEVVGTDGSSTSTVATVDIVREVAEDKSVDTVVLDQTKTDEVLQKVLEQKQNTVQIVVNDIADDQADEVEVTVNNNSVQQLSNSSVSLEIKTEDVTIQVPEATLQSLSESDEDLYFRIVPIRDEEQKADVIQNAIKAEVVQSAAGNSEVITLGTPMTIETNYQDFATKVTFSLKDITIPTDEAERQKFLSGLGVYIKHSDGEQELNRGTIIYDKDGNPVGIEIEISKFSTFTIVSISNTAPVASELKLSGTAAVGNTLTASYTYTDADQDKEGKSIIAWYRADSRNGKNKSLITTGSKLTYKITKKDQGKYIIITVTPVAKSGLTKGIAVSTSIKVAADTTETINTAPKAVSLKFSGKAIVGNILKASYTYQDAENDKEGKSTYQWYRADNANGENKKVIKGADEPTYTLTKADVGKYIVFEVTPVAASGTIKGEKAVLITKNAVAEPVIQYKAHIKLGLIGSKSYADKVAEIIKKDYGSSNVVVKKEGNYYRIYIDFVDKASAKAACEDLKKKKYIVNYYFIN